MCPGISKSCTPFLRVFRTLQICQSSGFIMNISNLLVTLYVEIPDFLPRRCAQGLLEICAKTAPPTHGFVADAIATINALGSISGMVFLVKVCQGGVEAG